MEISTKFLTLILTLATFSGFCKTERIAIVHWNDVNGQLERYVPGTQNTTTIPIPCDKDPCQGGIENIVHFANKSLVPGVDETKVFRLTPGNLVGGENGWLSAVGWEKYGLLVKDHYKPNVMSLGLKEFESGLKQTNTYIKIQNAPLQTVSILLSNVVCTSENGTDEYTFCGQLVKIHNLTSTVSVIGFINPNVTKLSSPGNLDFKEIVPAIQEVVRDHSSIKTFIALGDGSLTIAKDILDRVPEVKLVIYGIGFGSSKDMEGEYPMRYNNRYIATAGSYGSTIGRLVLTIDDNNGAITSTDGSQLVKTEGVRANAIKEVGEFKNLAESIKNYPVGSTNVNLEGGKRCWRDECNLGNLVADSMVHCALNHNLSNSITGPIYALWHGGALFDDVVPARKEIMKLDIHKWLPYHNRAHLVKINGSNLWEVFKSSATGINADKRSDVNDWGQFLQVSNGLEVYYKTNGDGAPELQKILVLHHEQTKPFMDDIVPSQEYYVVIPSFIKEGRNIYDFAKKFWIIPQSGTDIGFDDNCTEKYISGMGKIPIGFEERIWIDKDRICDNSKSKGGNTAVTVVLTIVIMAVLLGVAYVGYFYVLPRITGRHPGNFRSFD